MVRHVTRYLEHLPSTTDETLLVLRGHLLVEELITEVVETYLPNPKYLEDARLTFAQKVNIARAMCWTKHNSDIWPLVAAMNQLRNELAHSLDAPRAVEKRSKVIQSFLSSIEDKKFRSEIGKAPIDQQLRSVTLYIVAFLARFLEDVYAFRYTVDPLQLDPAAPRLSKNGTRPSAPAV